MFSTVAALCLAAGTITVTTDAKVSFPPNQVIASFSLQSTARDAVNAKRLGDERLTKLLKTIEGLGVPTHDVAVTAGGVNPDMRGSEVVGYLDTSTVTLTLKDMTRAEEQLSVVLRSGATPVYVQLKNTEHGVYEDQARFAAATAARSRAKGLLGALGGKLGLPTSVTDVTPPVDLVNTGLGALSDGTIRPSFVSRELTAQSRVTAQFAIDPPDSRVAERASPTLEQHAGGAPSVTPVDESVETPKTFRGVARIPTHVE